MTIELFVDGYLTETLDFELARSINKEDYIHVNKSLYRVEDVTYVIDDKLKRIKKIQVNASLEW